MKRSKAARLLSLLPHQLLLTIAALAGLAVLGWFAGCSHTAPYARNPADLRGVAGTAAPPKNESAANAQKRTLSFRLLLIGDAGHAVDSPTILKALSQRAQRQANKSAIVFLGDNVYGSGLSPSGSSSRTEAERRLAAQVEAAKTSGAEFIFVPGNHDWANGADAGLSHVLESERFIASNGGGRGKQLPKAGTAGPSCLDRPGVRLLLLDTQWFIHPHEKLRIGSEAEVFAQIADCVRTAGTPVVVLAHHPLRTNGPHGSFFSFRQHLFPLTDLVSWLYLPLPVLGSLYPLVRSFGVTPQDAAHPAYQSLVKRLRKSLRAGQTFLYAAGHEHNLQVFAETDGPKYSVVSGSGSATSPVGSDEQTLFAEAARGFMELSFYDDGSALLQVLSERNGQFVLTFERLLGWN